MPVAACALDVAGINGVNRFLAAFQALSNERKQHTISLV
jgi:hypothetical protein